MVRIRLARVGMRDQPSYRIVVAEGTSPRDGRAIDRIGHYNPRTDPPTIVIDEERALHWLHQGAQPSVPVAQMLRKTGLWERFQAEKEGARAARRAPSSTD